MGDVILQELPVEAQDLNPVRIRIALIVNADIALQKAYRACFRVQYVHWHRP